MQSLRAGRQSSIVPDGVRQSRTEKHEIRKSKSETNSKSETKLVCQVRIRVCLVRLAHKFVPWMPTDRNDGAQSKPRFLPSSSELHAIRPYSVLARILPPPIPQHMSSALVLCIGTSPVRS